jgi:RimJ/RimL family protein N-acetyltransferase
MELLLERCTIRLWRLDDAESLARHANNRKIWLAVRDLFPHPYTIQDAREFLQRAISEQAEMKFCVEIEGRGRRRNRYSFAPGCVSAYSDNGLLVR